MLALPPLRGVRAAFVFLTRLPVGGFPYAPEEWAWASAHFPLVGAAVGAFSALGWALLSPASPLGAAALAVTVAVLLTGAFHEDALADTADALGGGHDRNRVLAILKDSRIGAYGAVALCLAIVLRVTLIAAAGQAAPALLIAVHAAARLPAVWLLARLPYVTPDTDAKSREVARAGLLQCVVATLWTLAVFGAVMAWCGATPSRAAVVLLAAMVVALACARWFRQRLGGVTGDLLGATVVVSECVMWIAVVLVHDR